jgi:hypothetical protein
VDNSIVWVGKLKGKVKFSTESTWHCKSQKHQMGIQKEGTMANPDLGLTTFFTRDHSQLFIFTGEFLPKSIFNLPLARSSKGILK